MIPPGGIFNGEFWEGNTSANTAPENTLTAGKLLEMMRKVERDFPPLPSIKFDLYGHTLGGVEGYELNLPDNMRPLHQRGAAARRTLVVPRNQLERWAYELRRMGADVRVEPRYAEPPPRMEQDPTTAGREP